MGALSRVALLIMVALLVGCASTKQARSMEKSGFLGDLYPLMQKGKEGEALLVYKNPRVALIPRGTYKKMLLEPVTMWGPPAVEQKTAPQKELQAVADMLYSLMYESLSKDYEMVSVPEPNTLRIQAAITRANQSYVVLRAVSTIPAPMNYVALASFLKDLGTGKPLFVGEASIEGKILDAQTGEVLGASADRRVGKRHLDAHSFDSWDDVHQTLAFWAEQVRYRLCQERGGSNCTPPKE
ncbi:MAG: DUF3313 domain-containing protein [Nitrospira sp. LK70]|nr:DUF3313 domain-containing protein [Nitrospira sp. LK70]